MFRFALSSDLRYIFWTLLGPLALACTVVAAALEHALLLGLVGLAALCAFPLCLLRGERAWFGPVAIFIGLSLVLFGAFPEAPRLRLAALLGSFGLSVAICKTCFEEIFGFFQGWQERMNGAEERRLAGERALTEAQRRLRLVEDAAERERESLRASLAEEQRLASAASEKIRELSQRISHQYQLAETVKAMRSELNLLRPDLYEARCALRAQGVERQRLHQKVVAAEALKAQTLQRVRELLLELGIAQGECETLTERLRGEEEAVCQLLLLGRKAMEEGEPSLVQQEGYAGHFALLEQTIADLLCELKSRCVSLPGFS